MIKSVVLPQRNFVVLEKILNKKFNIADWIRVADAYIYYGDYTRAIDVLNNVLELNPDSLDVLRRLANNYYFLENKEEALAYYLKILKAEWEYYSNIGEEPDPTMALYTSMTAYIDTLDTQFANLLLDYSLQTRNYMGYSDLDDERVMAKLNEISDDVDVGNSLYYAGNSLTFLENAAFDSTTINNDLHLNKILPYMYDYYPVFMFSDIENPLPQPEFYENYPIIVSAEAYEEGLNEHYDTIYKAWYKGDGNEIQIVPKNSRHILYYLLKCYCL